MDIPFLGQVELFPYNFPPSGYLFCHGRLLSISQNGPLFGLLGTWFGGDGLTLFALPNFTHSAPTGLQYCISLNGVTPDLKGGQFYIGEVALFPYQSPNELPSGWLSCDGRSLAVSDYGPLYQVIGNRFGGDSNNFNLPEYNSLGPEGLIYAIATTGKSPV